MTGLDLVTAVLVVGGGPAATRAAPQTPATPAPELPKPLKGNRI